jgi:hypothetical protein
MAPTLDPPVPAYLTFGDAPSVGPLVIQLQPQQGAGPNGVRPSISQGRADGPTNVPPEGKRAIVLL